MFLSDYSQTQSPNGRMFCIRFVEIFFRGGGQQNISHPPPWGVPPLRGGWTDKLTDKFLYQLCLKILIQGGQQNILKPTSKYLYLICHKYFLKPKTKFQYKNQKIIHILVSTLYQNPHLGWATETPYKCSTCKYEISKPISFKYFIKPR